ncbi:Protein of unknown function (DUF562) [Chlamydia serpentis]|uniref:Uncharacterized protein n=1 Tax=Chlamydia serpentis TaxID=1967782 RepID=A0A2R8FAY1_9CHLA|nr:DUF562 domain-containing protein [Chlamydia serpentis]SPN73590.1 Protein of unknown function (DUF562) [Chlamydia serpentis]
MVCSFIFSWASAVRQHFIRAFDFTHPLYSRITNFALGVIKAIPILGHMIVGVEWLISSCREGVVRKATFTSEVASIVKVEKIRGRDYLLPVEHYLSSVRVSVSEEDVGKVHGKLPENPFADMKSKEDLQFVSGQELGMIGRAFRGIRKRVTQAYKGVKQPEMEGIALVGIALSSNEEFVNFVRLANGIQKLHPNTRITVYLMKTIDDIEVLLSRDINIDCTISAKEKDLLASLGLDSTIVTVSVSKPNLSFDFYRNFNAPNIDLIVSCYGRGFEEKFKPGLAIQNILNLSQPSVQCISVTYEQEGLGHYDFSERKGWKDQEHLRAYTTLSLPIERNYILTLGLEASASGLLLDPFRVHAPLSRSHSCPSYLLDIQDEELRRLILAAFLDPYNIGNQEFRSVSINFGSSPSGKRWLDFLKRVLQSEDTQHVVVVCNDPQLSATGFTPEAVSELANELKESGYSCLDITSVNAEGIFVRQSLVLNDNPSARSYTVILTDLAAGSGDIRSLQLASDRILVSTALDAADACAAGCKILEYEDPNESWAQEIERFYQEVEQEEKPSGMIVPRDYFRARVCERIASERNFLFILDSAIKRAFWYSKMRLVATESEALGDELRKKLEAYVRSFPDLKPQSRARKGYSLSVNFTALDQAIQNTCLDQAIQNTCDSSDEKSSSDEV